VDISVVKFNVQKHLLGVHNLFKAHVLL
jgi:hypothetical protein